jgi:2-C-methyl-D-erythritol 4-phosphate cytidylyltransferase
MNKKVIIVAGGIGKRMNSNMPKQFLKIGDEIILMRTIRVFHEFDRSMELIVTLPGAQFETWNQLCEINHFTIPHRLVKGGETRFNSVKNALNTIHQECIIAVHDGVRPLVSQKTIKNAFKKAEEKGNAIPVVPINESIRYISETENKAVARTYYKTVQTPQVFRSKLLKEAYQQEFHPDFTDDASVVESKGAFIETIEGNTENIKITTKKDLDIAGVLLSYLDSNTRN